MAERTNNISEITSFFSTGFQRTNRFEVSIIKEKSVAPAAVNVITNAANAENAKDEKPKTLKEILKDLEKAPNLPDKQTTAQPSVTETFWASEAQIPAQTLYYFPEAFSPSGPPITIPVRREYDDRFLISFIVDQNWKVREYFETWYDSMFTILNPQLLSQKSNTVVPRNTASTLATIEIKALDVNGGIKQIIKLYEAYPKLLLPSQFSHDIPNQYLTLTVDFNYRYYKITKQQSGSSTNIDNNIENNTIKGI